MSKLWNSIGRYSKSLGVLIVGAQAWGAAVVVSPAQQITASEWMELVGVGVAFLLALLVPNASRSEAPRTTVGVGAGDAVQ